MNRSAYAIVIACIMVCCSTSFAQNIFLDNTSITANQLTDDHISTAIDDIKNYLYSIQNPTGSWDRQYASNYPGGETAIVVYALLAAGESAQHPQIEKAIQWLKHVEMDSVYTRSLRLHVWAQLPDQYRTFLQKDATWLLTASRANKNGLFSYHQNSRSYDHSNTQYGVLGLWEAAKRNVNVPKDFWQQISKHFIEASKQPDSGWGYTATGRRPTGSMTCAGLTALLIADQQLNRRAARPKKNVAVKIDQGFRWMNRNFNGVNNPGTGGSYKYYYLYGVERVGLAGGYRYFNNQDWFDVGARFIISNIHVNPQNQTRQTKFAANTPDTAFALLFLARGRVPVWIGKLTIPGNANNARPYDIDLLTRYLSSLREGELNWQLLDVNQPPHTWLYTPLAYLSISKPITVDDQQVQNIRQYLDFGGMLLVNPETHSPALAKSVRQFAKRLYPENQYKWRLLPPEHPIYTSLHQASGIAKKNPIMALTNGLRELIVMPNSDWGKTFQTLSPGKKQSHWKLMTNLFALVTNRGHMGSRMDSPHEYAHEKPMVSEIVVGRVDHPDNWNPEPAMWVPAATRLFNQTAIQMKLQAVNLDDLADCKLKLAHITGVDATDFSEDQLDAIKQYVKSGGTLLIETAGGKGQFSHALAAQLSKTFADIPIRLGEDHPIYTGLGLRGGYDCTTLLPRRTSVLDIQRTKVASELVAFYIDERPAIIISHDDLALGLLGVRQWGIRGLTRESTRKLVTNLLIWIYKE